MDFMISFPKAKRHFDSIWVIFDKMTKSAHLLLVKTTDGDIDYTKLYIYELVKLYGVPLSIIFDCDSQFTSDFWRSFQRVLSIKANYSMTFHPQIDG